MSAIKYLIVVAFVQIIKPYWMEISIIVAAIVIFLVAQHLLKLKEQRDERREQDAVNDNRQSDEAVSSIGDAARDSAEQTHEQIEDSMKQELNEPDTLGLMFNTLSNIGCQPKKDDDGTLRVSYQGENFHMEFFGRYVRIWDPRWAGIKADDPNMPKVREAVNAANYYFGTTVVLDNPNEKGIIAFHTISDIMLHPACPDNDYYVKAVLDTFFDAKEQVMSNYKLIDAKQMETQKNRRPIGFTTNTNSNE